MATPKPLPPIRACLFDLDGLLINSEDIYTTIYNTILATHSRPPLPWHIKAYQQSRGREGTQRILDWAALPLSYEEWGAEVANQHGLFKGCVLLPGVEDLLRRLKGTGEAKMAIASSATSKTFALKVENLPFLKEVFPAEWRVLGDDPVMAGAEKKPAPDVFLAALKKVNALLDPGERGISPEECLVFEDSIAGVEAGRRAGMRVCWVPHRGLREVCREQEMRVLGGRGVDYDEMGKWEGSTGGEGEREVEEGRMVSEDGWAEMLTSLEEFDYGRYGIRVGDVEG